MDETTRRINELSEQKHSIEEELVELDNNEDNPRVRELLADKHSVEEEIAELEEANEG